MKQVRASRSLQTERFESLTKAGSGYAGSLAACLIGEVPAVPPQAVLTSLREAARGFDPLNAHWHLNSPPTAADSACQPPSRRAGRSPDIW